MTTASAAPPQPQQKTGRHQRSIKNYLLDAKFQLKYTGYIVGVTLFVSGILGAVLWNTSGDLEHVRHKDEVLRRWCDEVGRDHTEIERTLVGSVPIIRDTEPEARKVAEAMKERNTSWRGPQDGPFGPAELVAEKWAPFLDLGFEHIYIDCPAPFDHETIERLANEVRPMLESR